MSRLEELAAIRRPLYTYELEEALRLADNEKRAKHRRELYANDPVWRLSKLKACRESRQRNAAEINRRRRERYAKDAEFRQRRLATDGKPRRAR